MKLYGYYAPYEEDADDVLQEIAQYQVFFTLFRYLYDGCMVYLYSYSYLTLFPSNYISHSNNIII